MPRPCWLSFAPASLGPGRLAPAPAACGPEPAHGRRTVRQAPQWQPRSPAPRTAPADTNELAAFSKWHLAQQSVPRGDLAVITETQGPRPARGCVTRVSSCSPGWVGQRSRQLPPTDAFSVSGPHRRCLSTDCRQRATRRAAPGFLSARGPAVWATEDTGPALPGRGPRRGGHTGSTAARLPGA